MTVRYMMFITHREDFRMEDVPPALFTAMDKSSATTRRVAY